MKEVVYTVYTCSGGRWIRGNVFNADQKDEAVEAAKGQFGGGKLDGVSVVRETYNPDDGSTDELAIYSDKKTIPSLGWAFLNFRKLKCPRRKKRSQRNPRLGQTGRNRAAEKRPQPTPATGFPIFLNRRHRPALPWWS